LRAINYGGVLAPMQFWQPPRARYDSQDVFGMFDLIGVIYEQPVMLVQVCRQRELAKHQDRIEPWVNAFRPAARIVVAAYRERKSGRAWSFWMLQPSGAWAEF